MFRGVRSWLRATIPRLASSASPNVGVGAGGWEDPTRAGSLRLRVSTCAKRFAGLLAGMKHRARRQYDERVEIDDAEGIEAEMPLEQLHDIKANSVSEWIAIDRVRRSIARSFRDFLQTYVDEHRASVYGQRIRHIGE